MRCIAIINQKGGVGKTTTSANLGAALAEQGRRVVVVDMDPQANLSLHLGIEVGTGQPSIYPVLLGRSGFAESLHASATPRLSIVPSSIDLSGAELELASTFGREHLLRDALRRWVEEERAVSGRAPADYVIFDCPPSLGLLSVNALAAAGEVIITVQTEFMALMGMSKLVEVVQLIRQRLNPELEITGILPCLYDSRLRLAREVLGEIRNYFPGQVLRHSIRSNVKLAEAPSFGQTILDYAPESNGALDYRRVALEILAQEERDADLGDLPAPEPVERLPQQPAEPAGRAAAGGREEAREELREVVLRPRAREGTTGAAARPPAADARREPRGEAAEESESPGPGAPAQERRPAPKSEPPSRAAQRARRAGARPAKGSPRRRESAVEAELRALGGEGLPTLPPEAFEIPSNGS